jgi:hypothetical protein
MLQHQRCAMPAAYQLARLETSREMCAQSKSSGAIATVLTLDGETVNANFLVPRKLLWLRQKNVSDKMVVSLFSAISVGNILRPNTYSANSSRDAGMQVFNVKRALLLSDLNQNSNVMTDFSTKFRENTFHGSRYAARE